MIDAKRAVEVALMFARDMLGRDYLTVDEIERDVYGGRDVWRITVGFRALGAFTGPQYEYRSVFVDAETGEPLGIKIRQLT